MIKKSINFICFCLIVVTTSSSWAQSYSGGSGTAGDPFRIATVQDLITLSRTESHWSASTVDYNNVHKYFIQTADIVFNSNPQLVDWNNDGLANWSVEDQKGFNPIGRGAYGAPRVFTGSFDGGNYSITNLYINQTATTVTASEPHDIGMFGYTFAPCILKNIHLKNVNITSLGPYRVGALIGYAVSHINFHVSVNNCSSSGNVSGKGNSTGGLVGYCHTACIQNSYSSCNVTTTSNDAGGIVGSVNYNNAFIKNCFSTGTITGNYNVGGIVGSISSNSGYPCEISNCYSTSAVNGYDYVGGLIGYVPQETSIFKSYSTGLVTATVSNPKKGGFIGYIWPSSTNVTVSNCFWNTESSGQVTSYGGAGAVGKTTAQMRNQATFSAWNFGAGAMNWAIKNDIYNSYPYLQNFTYDTPGAAQSINPIPGLLLLNQAPSNIAVSASSINENAVANSTVGSFSSTDPDAGNTFIYTLASGAGDTDNASFSISGANLNISSSPDYETKNSYSIRIRTTDQGGLSYEKVFTITINDLNETPTNIAVSASAINENTAANSTVGSFSSTDPDAGNTFTYTLASGSGDTDNASFSISGANLNISSSPDYETKNSYSVRIRTTDQGGLSYEKVFTVSINDLNETPTNIAVSASAINENAAANSTVGSLSSTDPDASNTFTYTLVSGAGDTDNASFSISGANLNISSSPDYETKNSYSIRIRTTDQGGLSYEKVFTVSINDLNETPTNIAVSASAINENTAANSTVGSFSSTDPDASNTFTYTLVSGAGDTDNASFSISGANLNISSSPDYETKNSYSIRIRTTDQGGLSYEKVFTITINDLNETPTNIAVSASAINENTAANSTVGSFSSTDPDAGNTFTYTLASGSGDTDNASFSISGANLNISSSPDYETKNSYSVRIRTTDQGGLSYEKVFTIIINNIDESPILSLPQSNYSGIINVSLSSISVTNSRGVAISYAISPNLPSGIVFNSVTGTISGTPTVSMVNTNYLISGTNSDGTGSVVFSLFIDLDTDGDGLGNNTDPDIDGDGILNTSDSDINGDGTIDNGTDTDNDGTNDANDLDIDGDGILNTSDSDINGDGTIDNGTDTDNDGTNDANDLDIDGDGILNTSDSDINGDGTIDNGTDTDNDGTNDANDLDIDGDGILNTSDSDINGDGTIDNGTDTDNDGTNDANDLDIDGDGILNTSDSDINGDGTIDNGTDTDNDGTNDANDLDIDGDGILNTSDSDINGDGTIDNGTDTDNDGTNDANDLDIDGDGILNTSDSDINGDGTIDNGTDTDNDGTNDANDPDIDGDGILNTSDSDINGDGTIDNGTDTDNDGTNDANDLDIDADGVPNTQEVLDSTSPLDNRDYKDTDSDAVPDYIEVQQGTNPTVPGAQDTDGDGVPNYVEVQQGTNPTTPGAKDTDGDGVPDYVEVQQGTNPTTPGAKDTDGDGVPDYIEVQQGTSPTTPGAKDTDGDGVPDYIEIQLGNNPAVSDAPDTDGDGFSNYEEGYNFRNPGASRDTDRDGTPDYLDLDSDGDSIQDRYDAFANNPLEWTDSDSDGTGDNADADDDNDSILDVCDVDRNGDGIPDNGIDMDGDGIIDDCDTDKDGDGVNNTSDNCPNSSNANQADRDRDGLGDVCDTIELNSMQALTPNGDGINDTWVIYNLGNHPGSIVKVFNSNGVQVFYSANYQNNWEDYEGKNEMLPNGSYMYQIDLGGDGSIDSQGWLYITK